MCVTTFLFIASFVQERCCVRAAAHSANFNTRTKKLFEAAATICLWIQFCFEGLADGSGDCSGLRVVIATVSPYPSDVLRRNPFSIVFPGKQHDVASGLSTLSAGQALRACMRILLVGSMLDDIKYFKAHCFPTADTSQEAMTKADFENKHC